MKRHPHLLLRSGILASAVITAWIGYHSLAPANAAESPKAALAPSATPAPGVLRYGADAPQLSMLHAEALPSLPVPLADALSARVTYDDDATARVGVGLSGRIVALHAEPGAVVKAGQVLAEIDSPDVGSASADLDKARADEERKRLAYQRGRDLVPGEGIAVKDWESLQADLAQARAETARAEQRLRNLNPYGLRIVGQRVSLVSPVSGIVTERNATPGLEVNPGLATPLFVVTDPTRLWVMIDLPENLMSHVRQGGPVAVESDAWPGERFTATILQAGSVVDPDSRRITVRARLANPGHKLLPEMFVRAYLLQDGGKGVRVPNSALVSRGIYTFVYVQTAPGEFHRRQVTLLTRGADYSFVGDGLKGGEQVVTTDALLLDAELTAREETKS